MPYTIALLGPLQLERVNPCWLIVMEHFEHVHMKVEAIAVVLLRDQTTSKKCSWSLMVR